MRGRRFDLVLLDVGGVLLCPEPATVVDGLRAAGLAADPERLLEAHYRGMHAVDEAASAPEQFDDYHRAYAAHLGFTDDHLPGALEALAAMWGGAALWTHVLPGVEDGLAAIGATGASVAIVSNADGTMADHLPATGLVQVGPGPGVELVAIVDSGEAGVAKPDPRIFELALAAAGVPADRALHVGDAYHYDVRGARAAGVHPVLMDPLGLRTDVDCARVTTLAEVADLVFHGDGRAAPAAAHGT